MTDTMTSLSDLVVSKYNAAIRIAAEIQAAHPQFFTRAGMIEQTKTGVFTVFSKLTSTPATRTLTTTYTENDDSMAESQVSISATEYGNALATLQGLRTVSIIDMPAVTRQLISINMGETLDRAAALGIYNGLTVNSDFGTIDGALTPDAVDKGITKLEDDGVPPFADGLYAAIITPRTKRDLFGSDDIRGLIPLGKYSPGVDPYNREMGAWLGIRWVVTPHGYNATSDSIRHDYPIIFGFNAFGQVNGYAPQLTFKAGTDDLQRRDVTGWKAQRGYGVVETANCIQYDVKPSSLVEA